MRRFLIGEWLTVCVILMGIGVVSLVQAQTPIPPAPGTNEAITKAGAAAAANREAYIAACRGLADDFGVKLPITITPGGTPAPGPVVVPPVPPKPSPKVEPKVNPIGKINREATDYLNGVSKTKTTKAESEQ